MPTNTTITAAFDRAAVALEVTKSTADKAVGTERRKAACDAIASAFATSQDNIRTFFQANPADGGAVKTALSALTDDVVTLAFNYALSQHPNPNPSTGERLALLAVGGYGRGEMAPKSDVDLLFVTPTKMTPWAESVIEETLYLLWDLKLKVGHASRSIDDCLRLGAEDFTIRTSLVELRHIAGDQDLSAELARTLSRKLFKGTAAEFIEAKLAERSERHRKQGGQRYMVEPNVKEGKGGLRDLQSLFWIGKYIHNERFAEDLIAVGVFNREEYDRFFAAGSFLWAVRCHLHYITGRATDVLSFDMQIEVAAAMGYQDAGGRRAVEHFMQDYFRHATAVGDLTRIFITDLEAKHLKQEPMLLRLFARRRSAKPPYAIKQNRLTVSAPKTFLADPMNMLRIFDESLRTGTLLHPDAMRLLAANLELLKGLRDNPEANKLFFNILLKRDNPERALRRMNELGVLGAFIPDFARIVAMMQFNMYHSYTVDEHTIQCISTLAQIEREELVEELPVASGILSNGVNRKVLYAALLLHDIGKGMDEDHSITGARIARRLAPRLGLKPAEAETAEWLVRNHLLMSDTAQKRDIAEPRTVQGFAKAVKSVERLNLLTVLTVCDIRGVGPDTWNNWKAMLLRGLHQATRDALENGIEDLNRATREADAKRALREALTDWDKAALKAETGRHYGAYWQGLPTLAHATFANLLQGLGTDEIRIDLMPDEDRDATRICFAVADHPGLFSRLAGALALSGANVVDARTYTTRDGFATAAFWVQDGDGTPYERDRLPRLETTLHKTLSGKILTDDALVSKNRLKKREKAFRVPTTITFDNEGSAVFTIIEVDTRDRPGLLHDLTRALAKANVYLSSAVIATYGEQAVDTFYVKDAFGLKFHSETKQQSLAKRLRTAIEQAAERAK